MIPPYIIFIVEMGKVFIEFTSLGVDLLGHWEHAHLTARIMPTASQVTVPANSVASLLQVAPDSVFSYICILRSLIMEGHTKVTPNNSILSVINNSPLWVVPIESIILHILALSHLKTYLSLSGWSFHFQIHHHLPLQLETLSPPPATPSTSQRYSSTRVSFSFSPSPWQAGL